MATTSAAMTVAGRVEASRRARRRCSAIVRWPVDELEHRDRRLVEVEGALRRQQDMRARGPRRSACARRAAAAARPHAVERRRHAARSAPGIQAPGGGRPGLDIGDDRGASSCDQSTSHLKVSAASAACCSLRRRRVPLDVVEGEIGVARRLRQALVEIGERLARDEVVVLASMPATRSEMMFGENISVSEEAMASSSERSRTKCT